MMSSMTNGDDSLQDKSEALNMELVLPLPDLIDFFPPPHRGRIVSGLDVLTSSEFGFPPQAVFNFSRTRRTGQPDQLVARLTWEPAAKKTPTGPPSSPRPPPPTTAEIPVDFDGCHFRLLPYDPVTGNRSPMHRYSSVADLAARFPPFARVVDVDPGATSPVVRPGDQLKLLRLVYRNGDRCVECRRLADTRIVVLPFGLAGEFVAVDDDDGVQGGAIYSLHDLFALFPPRRRRLMPCDGNGGQLIGTGNDVIPGIPIGDGDGDLFFEVPSQTLIAACPVDDPSTVIRLPDADRRILVVPDDTVARRGHSLGSLVANSRGMFPLTVRVTDWTEETTILENHYVRPGVELVLHGPTKQSKVLARTSTNRYFAIPLTYRGRFRRRPRVFAGARQLSSGAKDGCLVRVVYIDLSEQLQLTLGDVLRVRVDPTPSASSNDQKKFVRCERCDGNTSKLKTKEIKIPMNSAASFEELLGDVDDKVCDQPEHTIDQLSLKLGTSTATEIRVTVTSPSDDPPRRRAADQLRADDDLTLTALVVEPSVYASVDAADRPAFNLPLRTPIFVRFVSQLERSASPLLAAAARRPPTGRGVVDGGQSAASVRPRLSTLDRCAELLSEASIDALTELKPVRRQSVEELMSVGWRPAENSLFKTTTANLSDSVIIDVGLAKQSKAQLARRYRSAEHLDLDGDAPATAPVTSSSTRPFQLHQTSSVDPSGGVPAYKQQRSVPDTTSSTVDVSPRTRLRSLPAAPTSPRQMAPPILKDTSRTETYQTRSLPRDVGSRRHGDVSSSSSTEVNNVAPAFEVNRKSTKQVTFTNSNNNEGEDEDEENFTTAPDNSFSAKAGKFKLRIPDDGNLYNLSAKRFAELLGYLKLDEQAIQVCRKSKMDGKQFSRLTENEMELSGLMHPVLVHFRRLTVKKSKRRVSVLEVVGKK